MDKRTFLKLTSAAMASPLIAPLTGWVPDESLKNWAGNLTYSTKRIRYVKNVNELQQFVKSQKRFKVLGTRHCFNQIADSKDQFVSVAKLDKVIALDASALTVTIGAGMKYGDLAPYLEEKGYALHNLASLPHISVAGAITTATHGSGVNNGNLATGVAALEIVTADGSLLQLSRKKDAEKFNAAVVGLGAIGVITKITLDIRPTFTVRQYVYQDMPFSSLKENFDTVLSSSYSVSLFTDWQNEKVNEVWIKAIAADKADFANMKDFYGGFAAKKNLHPIVEISAENCTEQMGVPGPWFDRLPHFKMGFTPSSGVELQSEYFIPREHGYKAFMVVAAMGKEIGPHLLISEIRTIKADDFWMSPCYKRDCVAIHFTWKQDWPAVSKLLPKIEAALSAFDMRPHWGKLFAMDAATLRSRHPQINKFKEFVAAYDSEGKFRNEFLQRYI
ncbi:MAG: FAD-binding protein [Chitinophagaceae bacterium]|nr:MAG: FAD-binding protein [Chitinophagaceae bacterium]